MATSASVGDTTRGPGASPGDKLSGGSLGPGAGRGGAFGAFAVRSAPKYEGRRRDPPSDSVRTLSSTCLHSVVARVSEQAAGPGRTRFFADGNHCPALSLLQLVLRLSSTLSATYGRCNPEFRAATVTPRRLLTQPSTPAGNAGLDNKQNDLILGVNDILGQPPGRRCALPLKLWIPVCRATGGAVNGQVGL